MKYLIFILFASCSLFGTKGDSPYIKDTNVNRANDDYSDQLGSISVFINNDPSYSIVNLNPNMQSYLQKIAFNLMNKNELFFTNKNNIVFYIINTSRPIHFSLPNRTIYLSKGLLEKYVKSEKILFCILTYELIRIEKSLYKKNLLFPTQSIQLNTLIGLLRMPEKEKIELHKWAFYILRRAGVEADNYLSWLQIQNRNSFDFASQLGGTSLISIEEYQFKAFLIQKSIATLNNSKYDGSTKEYYDFIHSLKRI